jgi:predicted nucleic acid-binding protein
MAGIVFDTSVYISALRRGDASVLLTRNRAKADDPSAKPLWLSAVVLEELYAGADDRRARKLIAAVERAFERVGRLLVPIATDWTACGGVLSRIGQKYGYEQIGRARMTNDTLIAVSAARMGFAVLTKNAADFRKIAEFRPFDLEVI